jgi:predicted nucleic acid-binding protein
VTLYLLDENVLRELKRGGHKNVHQWISTVDDTDLRISVATLFEKRRGAEALMKRDPQRARGIFNGIEALERSFADRLIPIDGPVVAEWTRLLGGRNKDRWDVALAATARIYGLVIVTRTSPISRAVASGSSTHSKRLPKFWTLRRRQVSRQKRLHSSMRLPDACPSHPIARSLGSDASPTVAPRWNTRSPCQLQASRFESIEDGQLVVVGRYL